MISIFLFLFFLFQIVNSKKSSSSSWGRVNSKNAKNAGSGGVDADDAAAAAVVSRVSPGSVLHLDDKEQTASILRACWEDDFLLLFLDESCHLVWEHHLRTATIVRWSLVPGVGLDEWEKSTSFLVTFDSGFSAIFKPCSSPTESYKSELLAHSIDRLVELHRTPAVVYRSVEWKHLADDTSIPRDAFIQLLKVRERCWANGPSLGGSLMGWTKYPLEMHDKFYSEAAKIDFNPAEPTQLMLEYVRLIMGSLLLAQTHELEDVAHVDEPLPSSHSGAPPPPPPASHLSAHRRSAKGRKLFLSIDNDRGRWTGSEAPSYSTTDEPVCNREAAQAKGSVKFSCSLKDYSTSHHSQNLNLFMNFAATVCLFPSRIVDKVLMFSDPRSRLSLSNAVLSHMPHGSVAAGYDSFDADFLDRTVANLGAVLWRCMQMYGRENVLFEEDVYMNVTSPSVHYSGNGHKFVRDRITGIWEKDEKARQKEKEKERKEKERLKKEKERERKKKHGKDK